MTTTPRLDKQLRQILDAAPDAMVLVDQGARVVAANREAERLFGWTDAELRGEPLTRLVPPRFQQVYDALVATRAESRAESPGTPPPRSSQHLRPATGWERVPGGDPPPPHRARK